MTDRPGMAQRDSSVGSAVQPSVVILVRHTEVHNPDNVLYGRLPRFRLSDKGVEQARRTADALAGTPIAHIFTSPMLRARQTASYISAKFPEVPVTRSWLLAELGSSWQGTRFEDFEPDFTAFEHRREPKDESASQVAARMRRFIRTAAARFPGQTVVGVSHGDPIKFAILCAQGWAANGHTARQHDPARGSMSRFTITGQDEAPAVTYFDPETQRYLEGEWERVATCANLPRGGMREVQVGPRNLLLIRLDDGTLKVVPAHCPHMRAHLVDGALRGSVLTCALHGAQFNVATGKTEREAQCQELVGDCGIPGKTMQPVSTGGVHRYAVREDGEHIWVRTGW